MDRRSYKPAPEGMEPREMLTRGMTAGALAALAPATGAEGGTLQVPGGRQLSGMVQIPKGIGAEVLAQTAVQRKGVTPKAPVTKETPVQRQQIQRIERLPYFLQQIDPNRPLPTETVRQIQADLFSLQNTLTRAPTPSLDAFNKIVKDTLAVPSIRRENAIRLDVAFGTVLTDAGGNPATVDSLRGSLRQLTQVDSEQPLAAQIVANDYATVLQVALGIGRPAKANNNPTRTTVSNQGMPGGPGSLGWY